jgi:hypothetical protein
VQYAEEPKEAQRAVSVDDCGTAVDNLCMIPARGVFAKIEIAQDAGRHDQQADELGCGKHPSEDESPSHISSEKFQ